MGGIHHTDRTGRTRRTGRIRRLGRTSRRLKELRRRVRSRRPGEVVVDGPRLVADVARWGVPIRELYVAEPVLATPDARLAAVIDRLLEAGDQDATAGSADRVWSVPETVLAGIAPTRHPQGVLAVLDEPRHPRWAGTEGIALFLDQVQDPGNTGAIIRSAAALGAAAVLLGPGCADPFHPAAVRGSAGTVLRVPVEIGAALADAAQRVRAAGGETWAADVDGVPLASWRPRPPLLLVLGAEGAGLAATTRSLVERSVTIPLARQVESLNVAVAAALLLNQASLLVRKAAPAGPPRLP